MLLSNFLLFACAAIACVAASNEGTSSTVDKDVSGDEAAGSDGDGDSPRYVPPSALQTHYNTIVATAYNGVLDHTKATINHDHEARVLTSALHLLHQNGITAGATVDKVKAKMSEVNHDADKAFSTMVETAKKHDTYNLSTRMHENMLRRVSGRHLLMHASKQHHQPHLRDCVLHHIDACKTELNKRH